MKKILILLSTIVIILLFVFKYLNYKRFSPPSVYDYEINDSVDENYYDPVVFQDYIENTYKIGLFARQQWSNYKIDVRFPEENNKQSIEASNVYNTMLTTTKILEYRLKNSYSLKKLGFTNNDIKQMEDEGISCELFRIRKQLREIGTIAQGNTGKIVLYIQELLQKKGYDILVDGIFSVMTHEAVIKFQEENNLLPTGIVDEQTFLKLYY